MGMTTVAVQLSPERAQLMRELVADMQAQGGAGLAERARAVGYTRESMHLQENADGALLLIHLGYGGDDFDALQQRIIEFPDTEFTRWWTPRFIEVVGAALPRPELLFSWEDTNQA